jgi:hypothetical protein
VEGSAVAHGRFASKAFNTMNSKPQTSHPFELGRFAFEDMDK